MTPKALALISVILDGVPTLPRASCIGMSPGFDYSNRHDAQPALSVCRHCAEQDACRRWAGATGDVYGVVGGQIRPWPRPQVAK
jgi:hypothetical protein